MHVNVSSEGIGDRSRRAFRLGLLTILPLLVWWAGWFPGFMSSDSIDQLGQVARFEFTDYHPAFHTIVMWLITRVWDTPGAVALVQVVAMAALLALVARRLVELGVPLWLGAGTAWLVSLLPAVGPTTISIWKDVPFSLALLWAFTELLVLARDGSSYWERPAGPARLGAALGLAWLFRHNGLLTVLALLVALTIAYRRSWRGLAVTAGVLAAIVIVAQGPLYAIFHVERERPATAELLIPDVAAGITYHPESFSSDEVAYLETIAPLVVWQELYDCYTADPLLFAPELDKQLIRSDPGPFLQLGLRSILRNPGTSLGHHWCMASFLTVPAQPDESYLQRPPYDIPPNTLGLARDPLIEAAFTATRKVFVWAEPPGRLWLTWRPALVLWAALGVYTAVALRRSLRRLLWPGALLAIHTVNVAGTSLGQEFRFAFPLYLMAWLSLPLVALVGRPVSFEEAVATPVVDGRPADHPDGTAGTGFEGEPGGAEQPV